MSEFLHAHLLGHRLHYTELNEIYISVSASAFGTSLVGIFVPIYLYNLGYGISLIAGFFLITAVMRSLVTPLAAMFLARYGAKHLLALSQFIGMAYVAVLIAASHGLALVLVAAALWGLNAGCYWLAYHTNFSAVSGQQKASSRISVSLILSAIAHALGPLLGGIIATQFGIEYGLMVAGVLLAIAAYVMLQTPETMARGKYKLTELNTGWRPIKRDLVANFANNSQIEAVTHIWPLFIFLFLGTYQAVGLLASLALVAGVITMFLVGKRGDRGKNRQQLNLGSRGFAIVHALRPLAQGFGGALGINVASAVFDNTRKVPFTSYFYQHASNANNRTDYVAKMEMIGGLGHGFMWLVILAASAAFSLQASLTIGFLYAAISVLFVPQILPRKRSTAAMSPEETAA